MADLLRPHPVVAPDQRGHGDSSTPPPPYDWWDLGRDLLEVVADGCGLERPVGLGHSSGAAALVMAELLRPGTFASLVLVEPIIFPVPPARMEDNPMTAGRPAAAAVVRLPGGRGGVVPRPGGLRRVDRGGPGPVRRPRAPPRGGRLGAASAAPRPRPSSTAGPRPTAPGAGSTRCPARWCWRPGAASASHPAAFLEAMRDRFGGARLEVVPGAGHFLPMERPEAVAALVAPAARPGRRGAGR